jgi:hypothetical protein
MKIAISIPDDIFEAAESHAKRVGIPRSRLYAWALSEYLDKQRFCRVKEALDRVYGSQSSNVDPMLNSMQDASLEQEDWQCNGVKSGTRSPKASNCH